MKTVFLVGLEGKVSYHIKHKTSIQFFWGVRKKMGKRKGFGGSFWDIHLFHC